MNANWSKMSADERRQARLDRWFSGEGIEFVSPEAKSAYQTRVQRVIDTVGLEKTPDQVPVFAWHTFMPVSLYDDVTSKDIMYDANKLADLWKRYVKDFDPGYVGDASFISNGPILEAMDYKLYKWPGKGVDDNYPYQCIEKDYMKAEDYDWLIQDPSDFWLRGYLPRIFGILEPLKMLSPFTDVVELPGLPVNFMAYGFPEVQEALTKLLKAGKMVFDFFGTTTAAMQEIVSWGNVPLVGGFTKAPYDTIGDTLRGTHGIIMDLYRHPKKVLEAQERLVPLAIKMGIAGPNVSGNPIVFIPLHKGADGFLNDEQFQTYYWPFLKAVIDGLVEEGCIPYCFAEGGYNSRLQHLQKDLPKGKCIWMFDQTDMKKAKEMLGDVTCIAGNVPISKILTSTVEDVDAYCKDLIETCGKGGGYILASGCAMDEARPDTLRAMLDAGPKYGVYK
jgi:uroporphyrinogen-III decarboxylase